MKSNRAQSLLVAGAVMLFRATNGVQASTLSLTTAGASLGFTLTTFATIDPGATGNTGPFGLAVSSGGHVFVNNYINNTRYVFADTDGQTTASALDAVTPSNSYATAFATASGQVYGGANGQFVEFNSDGTINHALTALTQTPYFGMWGNPVNGHILATTGQGQIIDIDPLANGGNGSARVVITPGLIYDGLSVSPDGTTVYVEENDHIRGYNIATGAQVFDSGLLTGGPDGVGVISSSNSLNGDLVINFNGASINGGFAGLLNPTTSALISIASGGTRGNYVAPDVTNGSLLLDCSDNLYRLDCGPNCSIGSPVPPGTTTPEPAGLSLAAIGLFLIGASRNRRRVSL